MKRVTFIDKRLHQEDEAKTYISNVDEVMCLFSFREQLAWGQLFEGRHNYVGNKNEEHGSKITLGDFNCTMDKMDRDGGSKTQRLYRCCSNYALSKLIVDNGLEDLWIRKNPDS